MKKTLFFIVLSIGSFILFVCLIAYKMSPGSNSRAEYYRIDIPTDQIIEKVTDFKEKYPEYKYTRTDRNGNQYIYMEDDSTGFYLNLPSLNVSVACIIKGDNREYRIGLTSANGESIPGRSQSLNTGDIPRKLNQEIKKVFEEEFLDRMGKWEHVNTGNSFFGLYF